MAGLKHSAEITENSHTFFGQKFRENNGVLITEKWEIYSYWKKKFRQINYLV